MKRWEYKIINDPSEQWLNEKGREWWELICITSGPSRMTLAYLRREILEGVKI